MVNKTAKLPKEYKTCETCRYYDPEGQLNIGVCLKNDWPVMVEAHETCDQWEGEEGPTEKEKQSMYSDYLYQKYKEEDY